MDLSPLAKVPYFMDAFTKWTVEMPDSRMLVDDQYYKGWTRARVDRASARVYGYLKQHGIGREDFVMICLPRGVFPIIAMIGVWKAGAAFVAVEDTYAPERIEFIRNDCGCKLTIDANLMQKILNDQEPLEGYERADDHDACFAVYTSGSTGRPKGVLHEYGDIKLDAIAGNVQIEPGARGALIAPLNFVVSIKSLTGVMYAPCCFYIVPLSTVKNPRKLLQYYIENKIVISYLSPSLIRAVGGDLGPYLKIVHTGSEPANGISLDGIKLVNNYAMSEGAFTLCQFEIDKPYDECPVGKPNTPIIQIRLVDEDGNDVPQGETGEIIFENPFFRHYINLPEQTAEALRDGWYHTGDLGRMLPDGNLVLVGRANDMIKIDGNRIEPAEIEAAFKRVTGKEWAAAKGFEKPDQSFVCVYYLGELEQSEDEIRKAMEQSVPYYMIPAFFMQIKEPPLLPNGKLARKELPDPRATIERGEYVAPRTEFEAALCKAFESALGIDNISVTEDFYTLGGSSVAAMKVLSIMNLDDLSAVDIFQGRTVEKIAELYAEKAEATASDVSEYDKEMEARKHPHELVPTHRSVIDYQLFTPTAPMWIFPFLFSFGPDADANRVLEAARMVTINHPIFSTIYEFNEDFDLQQRYDPMRRVRVGIEYMTDAEFEAQRDNLIEPFDVLGSPMIRIRIIKTDSNCYALIVFHHIIMDGMSMQIVFQSFARAYMGQPLELDTYYSYLEDEERLRSSAAFRKAYDYYMENYENVDWCKIIEPDKQEPGNVNKRVVIPTNMTPENLTALEQNCDITRSGFLTAIATLALAKMSGKRDVMTQFAFHNRVTKRKQSAGGFLALLLPLGVRLDKLTTLADLYAEVNKQSSEGIANSVYDWATAQDNPYVDDALALSFENAAITDMTALQVMGAKMEPIDPHNDAALRRNFLQVFETADNITVMLSFMATIYSDERINEFSEALTSVTNKMIEVTDPASVTIAEVLA